MNASDEIELLRLCDLLKSVEGTLPSGAAEREALQKAGLALHLAFSKGCRQEIEDSHAGIGSPLSADQQERLKRMGLPPA